MDRTQQRRKDQFYILKAKAGRLEEEVERLKAEHQAEVDGLHATLIELRDKLAVEEARLDWLETEGGCGGAEGSWTAYKSGPGWEREVWLAATLREAVDKAIEATS